nr:nucleotidyl transferase AbiEii/AbiGii toxin family protein [Ignatzschineria indica]
MFESFRLVGGTALSLQLGHRLSVDIDLFSDATYGSIDFKAIDEFIEKTFPYHYHFSNLDPAMGKSYSVGTDKDNVVKLDVFYTDAFIQSPLIEAAIRMATTCSGQAKVDTLFLQFSYSTGLMSPLLV